MLEKEFDHPEPNPYYWITIMAHEPEEHSAPGEDRRPSRFLWITGQWPSGLGALRHANFRYFWFGQMISLIGTWMQSAAQGWLVLTQANKEFGPENAAFYVGLVATLGSLPMFLLTLFAGVVSDRYPRRTILIFTQTALGLLATALAVLVGLGHIRLWHVAALAAGSGLVMAFDMPTRQAFVKDIATPADLVNAIALNSSIFNLARIVGPAVAGVLIALPQVGIPGVLYLNAASYLAVIAGLLLIQPAEQPLIARTGNVWQHLGEGFRYVWGHATIRLLMILMAVYSVFGFSYAVLLSVIAQQVFHRGPREYGYLLGATGVGAFIGAVLLAAAARRVSKGRVLFTGGVSFSLALLAFSFTTNVLVAMLLLAVIGGGLVISSASINSAIQETTPDYLRGRVISMWAFIFAGFTPVGALYAGTVAHVTSPAVAMGISAAICLLTVGLVTLRASWLWAIE